MNKSGFVFGSSSIDLDDVFQKKASGSALVPIISEVGYRTPNNIDLVNRYKVFTKNTYATATNYKAKDGRDLSAIFEWGGYTPTVNFPITVTTNTALFEITGNYFRISVYVPLKFTTGATPVSVNPLKFSLFNLISDQVYLFTIVVYNPFNTMTQTINSSFKTNAAAAFTRVDVSFADNFDQFFILDGVNITYVNYTIDNVTTEIRDFSIPLQISRTSGYDVTFAPFNSSNNPGTIVRKRVAFASTELYSTGTSPILSYSADVILYGAGGSGGSGGTKSRGNGFASGGGGGGSGGFVSQNYPLYPSQDTYLYTITVGAGGAFAPGITNISQFENADGYNGNAGGASYISSDQINVQCSGGGGGQRGHGNGDISPSYSAGGSGGLPDGKAGGSAIGGGQSAGGIVSPGGSAGIIYLISPFFANGTAGSKGMDGSSNSDNTAPGLDGYCKITFYHVMVTTP